MFNKYLDTYEDIINTFNLNDKQALEIKKYQILPLKTAINYQGKKQGRLTILFKTQPLKPVKNKNTRWLVKCDCGTIKCITSSNIQNSFSCGCLKSELVSNKNKQNILNLKGQYSGFLEALEPTKERMGGQVIWKCLCHNCNNIHYVNSHSFANKETQSCGCTNMSHGEIKIQQILKENHIPFEIEKSFPTCKNPKTNFPLYFDFYIDNKYIIEYDGIQHFKKIENWDNLKATQYRDNIKNEWCKKNKIPLIRIPYTHYDKLELKDLLLKTTHFIVD